MAKTTAPLLSFGASGQIGKTAVFASWRGVKYARQHVIPSNPQTTAQSQTRDVFRVLSSMWTLAPADLINAWNAQASGNPYTGRNHFMGINTKNLRGQTSMVDFVGSPGSLSGFPPGSLVAVNSATVDEITATFTIQTLPTGWTATKIVGIAFNEQTDPANWVAPIETASVTPPTVIMTISGLDHAVDNVVSGWIVYTRADGKTAYGPSLTVLAAANP